MRVHLKLRSLDSIFVCGHRPKTKELLELFLFVKENKQCCISMRELIKYTQLGDRKIRQKPITRR